MNIVNTFVFKKNNSFVQKLNFNAKDLCETTLNVALFIYAIHKIYRIFFKKNDSTNNNQNLLQYHVQLISSSRIPVTTGNVVYIDWQRMRNKKHDGDGNTAISSSSAIANEDSQVLLEE